MDVEARIEALTGELANLRERVRRLRGAAALGAAACLVVLLTGATHETIDVLRTRRLEVLSPNGQTAISLAVTDDGNGAISLFDDAGHPLVALRVSEQGTGQVITFNRVGHQLVELGRAKDGEPGAVWVFDGAGRKLGAITSGPDGDGELRAYNRSGHMLSILRGTQSAGGALRLSDGEGRDFVTIGVDPRGRAGIHLADGKGNPALSLSTAEGKTRLYALGEDGAILSEWPAAGPAQ
jgi:hypothetical protein